MTCLIYTTVRTPGLSRRRVQAMVRMVLSTILKRDASVSIHFVGVVRMRTLNRVYRGIDRPTDVLSFSAQEGMAVGRGRGKDDLGDIFLCVPHVRRQSRRFGVSYEEEAMRMLVHGLLHLSGFDHNAPRPAQRMFALQEKFVQKV